MKAAFKRPLTLSNRQVLAPRAPVCSRPAQAQRALAARLLHKPAALCHVPYAPGAHLASFPGLRSPHAHTHRFWQACSPCTWKGCSYVLRRRTRKGAPAAEPAAQSLPPPRLPTLVAISCVAALRPDSPASRDTRTRSSPRPRPCPHRVNRGIIPHCSRICPPSSRHAHCVYRLLCLLVGTIINLSPASTSPLWCACPEPHTCSPRHLLPTTRARAHCVTREN